MAALIWALMVSSILHACAKPPASPLTCDPTGCTLRGPFSSWEDRKDCRATSVVYPTSEEEILTVVAQASKNHQKIKVITKFSHTIPNLACPAGKATVFVSTEKYNSGIEIDGEGLTVTADSGVGLRDLIDKVEDAGLSLVAAPYWEGLSIGGLISTGAHGSSWWGKGGAVHDHVVGLSLVVPAAESEGYAKVTVLDDQNPIFDAAKVSLGLLGVISKVKLSLEPAFKRSITNNFTDDTSFEDEFIDLTREHEFADITWYPSRKTAAYRYDNRVSLNTFGDGVNDFIGFQDTSITISQSVRATEKGLEAIRSVEGKCGVAATLQGFKKLTANGLKNNLIFTGYPVVGRQGRMQTSGSCLHSSTKNPFSMCAWDQRIKGLFFYETTAIFPASKFRDFIHDVKKLRDIKIENFCGVDMYNGFLIRFIKASTAYLGQSEDSIVLDFNYYRADDPTTPRLNQDVWEEVEQMAFFKYGAKPHWAKNRNLAFLGVQQKYPNFGKFLAAKKELDPEGLFSSEWSDQILFGKETAKSDGCALEGQCVCSEDRHCSPSKGYFCKSGLVYTEARVCRYSPSSAA